MTFRDRLKGVGIALVILIVCFPIAAVMTIITMPLWSWFETQTGIEAVGHSGPAPWCYLLSYGLLVTVCTIIWSKMTRTKRNGQHG